MPNTPLLLYRQRQKLSFMAIAVSASIGILLLKFYAYYRTGSAAIFSDALESIVNVLAAGFGLYAAWLSEQPRDAEHPYGHGKIEFMAAGFEGGLILMAGAGILYQAYESFTNPLHAVVDIGQGIVFTLIALGLNLGLGLLLVRKGNELQSATLQSDGKHLLTDTWSSAGLLLGLALLYFTGWQWIDGTVAAIMGVYVCIQGIRLLRTAIGGLLDEADEKMIVRVIDILTKHRIPAWIDMHNLRIVRHGADAHIDCHVTLPWYLSLQEAHTHMVKIEDVLHQALGTRVEIFIHADPCILTSCEICSVPACAHRQHPKTTELEWTVQNVVANAKHTV